MKTYLICAGKAQESKEHVAMQQWDNTSLGFMASMASYEWSTKID